MTDKRFRGLSKSDLLDIILEMQKNEKKLQEDLDALKKQFDIKNLQIEEAGSITDAVFRLNDIFQNAERTAREYVEQIQHTNSRRDEILALAEQKGSAVCEDAQLKSIKILESAKSEALTILTEAKSEAAEIVSKAKAESLDITADAQKNAESIVAKAHLEFDSIVASARAEEEALWKQYKVKVSELLRDNPHLKHSKELKTLQKDHKK